MKIDWSFTQKIHGALRKFPEKEEEYRLLYPAAMRKKSLLFKELKIGASLCHGNYIQSFILTWRELLVAEFKVHSFDVCEDDGEDGKRVVSILTVEPGFEVFHCSYGFTVNKYGPDPDKPLVVS